MTDSGVHRAWLFVPLRLAGWLLVGVVAASCTGGPAPGEPCAKTTSYTECTGATATAALTCTDNGWLAIECRGPNGCPTPSSVCDQTVAVEGEPCPQIGPFGIKACSTDGTALLECVDGTMRWRRLFACSEPCTVPAGSTPQCTAKCDAPVGIYTGKATLLSGANGTGGCMSVPSGGADWALEFAADGTVSFTGLSCTTTRAYCTIAVKCSATASDGTVQFQYDLTADFDGKSVSGTFTTTGTGAYCANQSFSVTLSKQ